MSYQITIEMSDRAYQALSREAATRGTTPSVVAASTLEQRFADANGAAVREATEAEIQAGRERFERHFGSISAPDAVYSDNESIDADLAREYGNSHEDV
jgi:hypothetical protein